ncbi:hypothetical protein [Saezia sanguinis]|uniref:hypothetical protein n=1 Tax=Saezia sanguinis TaxID=1965230 RepID=UPI003038AD68
MFKKAVLFAAIVPVLVLAGCSNSEYEQARKDFMDGCTLQGGANEKICACSFDKAAEGFSKSEIVELNQGTNSANAQKFATAIFAAMKSCMTGS